MTAPKKYKLALVGTDSLRAQEIKRALEAHRFPLAEIEFFDPGVKKEFSKLTDFGQEPKVIHGLTDDSLEGRDLVFLAADPRTDRRLGLLAEKLGFKVVDLSEAFNDRSDVPLIVVGVNDAELDGGGVRIVANPHPATIILSHLFKPLVAGPGIRRAISFILRPASAFDSSGIDELASQSVSLLGATALTTKVFGQQMAFNLLSNVGDSGGEGCGRAERQIKAEVGRVLGRPDFPLGVSVIQASQFHTYAIMSFLELERESGNAELDRLFGESAFLRRTASEEPCPVSCVSVTGREEVFIGRITKEESFPRCFWIWAIADNLTRGSALNAIDIARALLGLDKAS